MDKSKIDRINYLSRKARGIGLTDEERAEREVLRNEYRAAVVGNLKDSLDLIDIKEQDGSISPLKKRGS